mgnify:CR=1 FL=1
MQVRLHENCNDMLGEPSKDRYLQKKKTKVVFSQGGGGLRPI